MIRVLLAAGLYPPESGGPATYAKMLATYLPEQDIEVVVLPFRSVRKYPKLIRHLAYFLQVYKRAAGTDIVYALDPVSVGLPAMFAAKLRRKKFMLRLGGDYAWEQGRGRFGLTVTLDDYTNDPKKAALAVRVLAKLQTFVARQALVVVAPSNYLKQVIESWGVPAERVVTIYSNLSPVSPTGGAAEVLQQYAAHTPVITTAARLVPWKGLRVLIDVVASMRDKYPSVLLLVIGDGPQEAELQAHIAKYGLQQHVRLLGYQPREQSANIISASDLFVLNTAYEGLSHQLLEVMDWETPIVTTTAGGNTELLSDGVDALLVPFDNEYKLTQACFKVLNNPDIADGLVRFAKKRTQDFTRAKAIDEIVTLLHEVQLLKV